MNKRLVHAGFLLATMMVPPTAPAAIVPYHAACPELFDAKTVHFDVRSQGWRPYVPNMRWELRQVPGLDKWLSCGYGSSNELRPSGLLPKEVFVCMGITSKDIRANVTGVAAVCLQNDRQRP